MTAPVFVDANVLIYARDPGELSKQRRAREVELRHRLSWWDSVVVGAAQLQGCALLLTSRRWALGGGNDPRQLGGAVEVAKYCA